MENKEWPNNCCVLALALSCVFFFGPPCALADEGKKVLYTVSSPGLELGVTIDGSLSGVGKSAWLVGGGTSLDSTKVESVKVTGKDGSVIVEKRLSDTKGSNGCRLLERFIPDGDSIRWELEITGSGAPWSTPIETSLAFELTNDIRHWTTWGTPTGANLKPAWGDPLLPAEIANRTLSYGAKDSNCFSVPLVTVMDTSRGLSLILSPELVVPQIDLRTSKDGRITFSRRLCRIDQGRPLRMTMHLVPHQPGWRAGLNWMVNRYSKYFDLHVADTWKVAGNAAYSEYEGELDAAHYMRMGFSFNWKASVDYLYMGMFLPLTDDIDWQWNPPQLWGAEEKVKKPVTIRRLREYSERMRQSGFHVLNYFNVGEVGAYVKVDGPSPRRAAKDEDLWKDPNDFLWYQLRDAHFFRDGKRTPSWEKGLLLDPGCPVYCDFLLDQVRRHIKYLPASSGIAADRVCRHFNSNRDDGITWINGKPAAMFGDGWNKFWAKARVLLDAAGKVAYVNPLYNRLDLHRDFDGYYVENQYLSKLNAYAFLSVHRPLVQWGNFVPIAGIGYDDEFQWNLYLGTYKTSPFPLNNHNLYPDYDISDQFHLDYGPLFDAYTGRSWVLDGPEVKAEGARANLFTIPGGYLAPVIMAGDKRTTRVRIIGLKRLEALDGFTVEVLHPGTGWAWKEIPSSTSSAEIVMDVPLSHGCALVRLSHTRLLPARRYFYTNTEVIMGTRFKKAKVHYTLDGSDPTPTAPIWNAPLPVSANTLVKARTFSSSGKALSGVLMREFIKIRPPAPELTPTSAFLNKPVSVIHRIPDEAELPGAVVRYTQDGSEPTEQSPVLNSPLVIDKPCKVQAKVFWGGQASEIGFAEFQALPGDPPKPEIYISDLPVVSETCEKGWNNQKDRSTGGEPLRVGGKKFTKGIGTHANSELVFAVKPEWKRFVAQVGIDDEGGNRSGGSAVFIVKVKIATGNEQAATAVGGQEAIIAMGAEKLLIQTKRVLPGAAMGINVRLPAGTKELKLIVWDSGDSTDSDQADWVNAGFLKK